MDTSSTLRRIALAAMLALAAPAHAQIDITVSPPSIQPGQPVALDLLVGTSGCYDIATTSVTRAAGHVDVVIELVPPPPNILCFDPPPPETVGTSQIGAFAAGSYTVTVAGSIAGNALQPGAAAFVVAGSSTVRSIPATGMWFLMPLALAVVGIGFTLKLRDSL